MVGGLRPGQGEQRCNHREVLSGDIVVHPDLVLHLLSSQIKAQARTTMNNDVGENRW